jgi:hypothetical protein
MTPWVLMIRWVPMIPSVLMIRLDRWGHWKARWVLWRRFQMRFQEHRWGRSCQWLRFFRLAQFLLVPLVRSYR